MVCYRRLEVVGGVVFRLAVFSKCGEYFLVWISPSASVICESCFAGCKSFVSIPLESDSKLSRIARWAFGKNGLALIHLPASVEVPCESCFANCKSLISIFFDCRSRLERIEKHAFTSTPVTEMTIPGGILPISGSAFDFSNLEILSLFPFSTTFGVDGQMFRDISGWQLIVILIGFPNARSRTRLRRFVNGALETANGFNRFHLVVIRHCRASGKRHFWGVV
jgi:hypothetical protein